MGLDDVDGGVVGLLGVGGCFGWEGVSAAAFLDSGVGPFSSFRIECVGQGVDCLFVAGVLFAGGKMPRGL